MSVKQVLSVSHVKDDDTETQRVWVTYPLTQGYTTSKKDNNKKYCVFNICIKKKKKKILWKVRINECGCQILKIETRITLSLQ